MATNFKTFNLKLEASTQVLEQQLIIFHKKISMDLLAKIVLGNPVRTGRSRGNWQSGTSTNESEISDIRDPGEVLVHAELSLSNLKAFAIVYLWNNAAYIARLEQGYSPQAPQGFVEVSVEAMQGVIKTANLGRV